MESEILKFQKTIAANESEKTRIQNWQQQKYSSSAAFSRKKQAKFMGSMDSLLSGMKQ